MRDIVSYVRIAVFERGMMGDGRFFGGFSFFFFSGWRVCVRLLWGKGVVVGVRYV